jgi:hypothetical protein
MNGRSAPYARACLFATLLAAVGAVTGACYHGGNRANAFEGKAADSQTSTLFIEVDVRFVSLDGKTFENVPAEYNFGPKGRYYDNIIGSRYDRKVKVLAGTHRVIAGVARGWIWVQENPQSVFVSTEGDHFRYPGSATNEELEYTAEGGKSYVLRVRKAKDDADGWRAVIVPRLALDAEPVSRKLAELPHSAGGVTLAKWTIQDKLEAVPRGEREQLATTLGCEIRKR